MGTKVGEASRTKCWGTQSWAPSLEPVHTYAHSKCGLVLHTWPWGPVTRTGTGRQKAQGQGLVGNAVLAHPS